MAENFALDLFNFHSPRKLPKISSGNRFNSPVTDEDIAIQSKGCVPKTLKNNASVLQVFYEWIADRNSTNSDSTPKCLRDLLEYPTRGELNYWLSCFECKSKMKIHIFLVASTHVFTSGSLSKGDVRKESEHNKVP